MNLLSLFKKNDRRLPDHTIEESLVIAKEHFNAESDKIMILLANDVISLMKTKSLSNIRYEKSLRIYTLNSGYNNHSQKIYGVICPQVIKILINQNVIYCSDLASNIFGLDEKGPERWNQYKKTQLNNKINNL